MDNLIFLLVNVVSCSVYVVVCVSVSCCIPCSNKTVSLCVVGKFTMLRLKTTFV